MRDQGTKTFHIYVDETSKSATFMGVGALFTRKDSGQEIAQMVQDAVPAHGQRADKEIHWSELTNHLLPLYSAVGVDGEERADPALRAMLNNRFFSHFKTRPDPFQYVEVVDELAQLSLGTLDVRRQELHIDECESAPFGHARPEVNP